MPTLRLSDFQTCHDCMLCKAKRTGLGQLGVRDMDLIRHPLQLVSADLAGPMRVEALGGVRFSLFLVCGYSHMVWIEGLKTKAEAAAAFEKWVVKVNAESPLPDIRVRRLYTDNGGEFVAKIFGDVCLRYWIVQTFTQPDCPSQNPFAERNISSINSLALTAMVTANSPRDQWWLAQNNAVNILNMFPKEGESISPHEYYYQRVPDLTMQLPWGCLCVAYRSKRLNGICPKWTAGSVKGTYAGVSNHKGRQAILPQPGTWRRADHRLEF
jgi:hypothetical protein